MEYMTMGQKHNITDKELFEFGVKSAEAARKARIPPIEVYLWEYESRVFLIGLQDGIIIDGKPARTVWEIKTKEEK